MNWQQWDTQHKDDCPLCTDAGGTLIWKNEEMRVVLVDDALFAGFTRVIWQHHVKEMTDLDSGQRTRLLDMVHLIETVQRTQLNPIKVNLASLGNITPHIHWHIIPRFEVDAAYPNPVWALSAAQVKKASGNGVSDAQIEAYVRALKIALWA